MKHLILGCLVVVLAPTTGCRREAGQTALQIPTSIERPAKFDQASQADIQAVAQANNTFGFDLYRKMLGDANLVFSPFSVSSGLSMTYAGAKGDTAAEMAKTLHFPFEGERLHLGYAGLLGKLSSDGRSSAELRIANAVWGPYDYLEKFLQVNRDCYSAHVRKIELVGAEPTVNEWVEKHTSGHIKELVPERSLSQQHVFVLTNAVYFKGEWKYRFPKSATADKPFRVSATKQVKAPMMQLTAPLRYAHIGKDESGAKLLVLPYKEAELSMVIVLPDKDDGLKSIEGKLTSGKLDGFLDAMDETRVRVCLPRFKIEGSTVSLNGPLKELGMVKAFVLGKADFSGIYGEPGLVFIWKAFHRAFVEVNEDGAEAAAVTVAEGKKGKNPEKPVEFTADHPFLFLIRDNRTGCILFLGRLNTPE
jgi:serpin B